jgi:hypothetical protein
MFISSLLVYATLLKVLDSWQIQPQLRLGLACMSQRRRKVSLTTISFGTIEFGIIMVPK